MHVLCITNQMNTTQTKHLWNSQSKDRDTHTYKTHQTDMSFFGAKRQQGVLPDGNAGIT